MSRPSHLLAFSLLLSGSLFLYLPTEAAGSFKDLKAGDFAADAAAFLLQRGIMQGYGDGTFRPEKKVNRAEAVKIVVSSLQKPEEMKGQVTSVFSDVPDDVWYFGSLEWARKKGMIGGPPTVTTFRPAQAITKAEFLKMLLIAYAVDPLAFDDVKLPLARDVSPKEWYYPYLRYALSASLTFPSTGDLLGPGREMTRGDTAVILHRFFLYREGLRTQALLSQAQADIDRALASLAVSDLREATHASARALLTARGAHGREPDAVLVKVAVKTAESVHALVEAYQAGLDRRLDDVISHAKSAWGLADQVRTISPASAELAGQLQTYAQSFADSARKQKR